MTPVIVSQRAEADEIEILEVDQDPSISGIDAPLSSIALLNDKISGASWIKTGPAPTDWTNQKIIQSNDSIIVIEGGTPSSTYISDIDGGTP